MAYVLAVYDKVTKTIQSFGAKTIQVGGTQTNTQLEPAKKDATPTSEGANTSFHSL
jgi:hypothetical protein